MVMDKLMGRAHDIEMQMKQLLEDKVSYSEMKEELIKRALNRDMVKLETDVKNMTEYTKLMFESTSNGVETIV